MEIVGLLGKKSFKSSQRETFIYFVALELPRNAYAIEIYIMKERKLFRFFGARRNRFIGRVTS